MTDTLPQPTHLPLPRPPSSPADRSPGSRYLLPSTAYWDQAWFEREQRELFGRTWAMAAYETDLPEPGSYLPVQVGLDPVLLVRRPEGDLRGFLNMCRHRGMALYGDAGRTDDHLRCPYHGWEYGPDGALQRIPQRASQFPDVDPAEWGLVPVAVDTWHGMVFVHPDPALAEPLATWLGDLPERIGPFDPTQLADVARIRVPVACNWKLYIENHIDVLHLWYLHDESLGEYDHTRFVHHKTGPHWLSEERRRPTGNPEAEWGALPPISHLPEGEREVLRANLIFPNLPLASTETMFLTYQVVPTGPETCELDVRVRGEAGAVLDEVATAQLLRVIRDEDGVAVEQIQRVVRSPRFHVGPLARTHEAPITSFQEDLLAYLS